VAVLFELQIAVVSEYVRYLINAVDFSPAPLDGFVQVKVLVAHLAAQVPTRMLHVLDLAATRFSFLHFLPDAHQDPAILSVLL